jgi:ferrochelatase
MVVGEYRMAFQQEPSFQHGQAARTAVLYCNLGTPSAPTAPALRKYLAEFLGDSRVVEIPKPIWWLILHGIILRVRPKKSAAKYASNTQKRMRRNLRTTAAGVGLRLPYPPASNSE